MDEPQIAGFELIEKLGEGGMASVWKARQVSLDRIVAIKVLPSGLAEDSEEVRRFHAEAKSAAKLKHQGIVAVYDVGATEDLYYIVMEYVAGATASEWMKNKPRRSEKDALQVADSVAEALSYAWEKERIIHCDVKPDNIMIDADGTIKVADLGLARSINAMTGGQVDSQILGTPSYMSPEMVQGLTDMDCRADIYSLGATLYELVTGKYPFQGYPEQQVAEMQLNETIDDPASLNPKLSKGFVWFLEKLMAKDRTKRHQNWAAVRADIARVRKGMIVAPLLQDGASTIRRARHRIISTASGRPASGVTPARKRKQRSPVPAILGVALLVALLGVVVWIMTQGESARPQPDSGSVTRSVRPEESDAEAKAMFEAASQWAQDNPGEYDGAISRFRHVTAKAPGTDYAAQAEARLASLYKQREEAVRRVLAGLKEQTSALVASRQYDEAIRVYDEYDGRLASSTKDIRMSIARELRAEKERYAAGGLQGPDGAASRPSPDVEAGRKFAELMDSVAAKLLSEGVDKARMELARGMEVPELASRAGDLGKIRELLDAATTVDERIMDSFREQKGTHVTLRMNSGQINFIVGEVKNGKVSGQLMRTVGGQTTPTPMSFGLEDLSMSEKVSRMPTEGSPEVSLVKGLMAYSAKAYPQAKTYLSKINPLLAGSILKRVP